MTSKLNSCKRKIQNFETYQFAIQTTIVLKRQLPELEQLLAGLSDSRKRPIYDVEELAMAVIVMFLNFRGSRNNADNTAKRGNFQKNIELMFGMRLPDLDTANRLMKQLEPQELEQVKREIVCLLIKRKILQKFRLFNFYHNVAIDGTGVHSFRHEPYPECPFKESKNGIKVWTAQVLEAKIVCPNGFSISIATEWIRNPANKNFDKQDCELKAFARLAAKIKKFYPRLPICITADGLYPNQGVFKLCASNKWKFIITLKDGNLKSVWTEINSLRQISGASIKVEKRKIKPSKQIVEKYNAYKDIEYQKFKLSVIELKTHSISLKTNKTHSEKTFAHISNFEISKQNLEQISTAGRLRWKIENEGFNTQKNGGYNLKHKYSRTSFVATQNYYQCLQIAHIINQLSYKSVKIQAEIKSNDSLKSNIEAAIAIMMFEDFQYKNIIQTTENQNCQIRY